MTKSSETRKINSKLKKWDTIATPFDRFVKRLTGIIKSHFLRMIDYLFFYKFDGNGDKIAHLFEMICVYVVLIYAYKGLVGGW